MNRLISLALCALLLLGTGCVGRAAPLPVEELEGSLQSSALHTQAPPGTSPASRQAAPEAAAPAEEEPEEPYIRVIDPTGPMVALTFDDGPHELYTDQILDVLEEHHAVATFFEVGRNVAAYPQPLVRMDQLGCEIASHSNAHRDLSKMRKSAMLADLDAADQSFIDAVGKAPTLVRPPYGAVNKSVKSATGRTMVTWTVDTEDWRSQDAGTVVEYVQSLSSLDGEIILMHSTYESTAQAVALLVPWLQEQGYQLVTVSELMAYYYGELPQPNQFYGYTYFATHSRTDSPAMLPTDPDSAPEENAGSAPPEGTDAAAGEESSAAQTDPAGTNLPDETAEPGGEDLPREEDAPAGEDLPAEEEPWTPYPAPPAQPVDTEPPGWLLTGNGV